MFFKGNFWKFKTKNQQKSSRSYHWRLLQRKKSDSNCTRTQDQWRYRVHCRHKFRKLRWIACDQQQTSWQLQLYVIELFTVWKFSKKSSAHWLQGWRDFASCKRLVLRFSLSEKCDRWILLRRELSMCLRFSFRSLFVHLQSWLLWQRFEPKRMWTLPERNLLELLELLFQLPRHQPSNKEVTGAQHQRLCL